MSEELLPLRLIARRLRVPLKWLSAEAESGRIPALAVGDGKFLGNHIAIVNALLPRACGDSKMQPAGVLNAH